jgi:uracil-DNA glycosylase
MLLGHNLDSESAFERTLERGGEDVDGNATWRVLRQTLNVAEIPPEQVFFTNFFMGLIRGASSVGSFPGRLDPSFVDRCRLFFVEQLRVVRPRLVLVMGIQTPQLLAPLSAQLRPWTNATSFKTLDARDGALVRKVAIAGLDLSPTFAVITHPSLRGSNVHRRRYAGLEGIAAEVALVRDACTR